MPAAPSANEEIIDAGINLVPSLRCVWLRCKCAELSRVILCIDHLARIADGSLVVKDVAPPSPARPGLAWSPLGRRRHNPFRFLRDTPPGSC